MINKVILIGNLGRDAEIRNLPNGSKVARFPIATNESYKDKNGDWQTITDWHDIVAWRALADRAERDCKKGNTVFVEGKLRRRKYTDQNGVERISVEVEAENIRVLDKKETAGHDEARSGTRPVSEHATESGYSSPFDESSQSDDLPF